MSNGDDLIRFLSIQQKISDIFVIVNRHGTITQALSDLEGQPAILMLLTAVTEQFKKLEKFNSPFLQSFEASDLEGIALVRNYIVHDYDGVNLGIIEKILRDDLPRLQNIIQEQLSL